MLNYINPRLLGLPPQTKIEEIKANTFAIVMNRMSRIIMADGRKIVDKADKIKMVKPGCKVVLKTNAPVCSKTAQFLADHGIEFTND